MKIFHAWSHGTLPLGPLQLWNLIWGTHTHTCTHTYAQTLSHRHRTVTSALQDSHDSHIVIRSEVYRDSFIETDVHFGSAPSKHTHSHTSTHSSRVIRDNCDFSGDCLTGGDYKCISVQTASGCHKLCRYIFAKKKHYSVFICVFIVVLHSHGHSRPSFLLKPLTPSARHCTPSLQI